MSDNTRHYCEDCRFFAAAATGKNYGRCHAPAARPTGLDHLISREYPEQPYATVMRVAQCGPEAQWFEPAVAADVEAA